MILAWDKYKKGISVRKTACICNTKHGKMKRMEV
jgi:hypothetical protein